MRIRHGRQAVLALVAFGLVVMSAHTAMALGRRGSLTPPEAARVKEIGKMIATERTGFGRPVSDRAAWREATEKHDLDKQIRVAEGYLKTEIEPFSRELFLQFSQTGNRSNWQGQNGRRVRRMQVLACAECVENKGRFLPALEAAIRSICSDPTWLLSACDPNLVNLKGEAIDIDLGAAMMAWRMATIYRVLGEKLSPEVRGLIESELRRRIFTPYRAMVEGTERANWWLTGENNWNAVCIGGVTGAALGVVESPEERAWFVAAAEKYIDYFLRGFTPDGYCTEGLGYWNYGYGHFIMLTEAVYLATEGRVDFLQLPGAALPGEFAARFEIVNGKYPAFADCPPEPQPGADFMFYLNRRLGLGLPEWDASRISVNPNGFYQAMMFAFPNSATEAPDAEPRKNFPGKRTYFDHVGILLARGPETFGAALKGGSNGEVHNHNDVGTFMVVSGRAVPLTDPGSETYTQRTFSSRRYESDVLNSFGHAVPRIAGQLQRTGAEAKARVVRTDFTDTVDTFTIDIASAYDVPELSKLERTFVYSRQGKGSLEVIDEVALHSPEEYETALITYAEFERAGDNLLRFLDIEGAVEVALDTEGKPFEILTEEIDEDVHYATKPLRVAVRMKEPVDRLRMTMTVRPIEVEDVLARSGLILNGGFERRGRGWRLRDNGISSFVSEPVHSGKSALLIKDTYDNRGSNAEAVPVPAEAGKRYLLKGWIYPIRGQAKNMQNAPTDYKGLGMYVRYLNENRDVLNTRTGAGYDSLASLGGDSKQWEPFSLPFETPEGTTHIQVWIHSYNGSIVEAVLDDLEVVEAE